MPAIKKVKTAIIGCGTICKNTYAPNLANKYHIIDLVETLELKESAPVKEPVNNTLNQ